MPSARNLRLYGGHRFCGSLPRPDHWAGVGDKTTTLHYCHVTILYYCKKITSQDDRIQHCGTFYIKIRYNNTSNNNNCNTSVARTSLKIKVRDTKSKIFRRNHKLVHAKSSLEHGTVDNLFWKSKFKHMFYVFLRKMATVS